MIDPRTGALILAGGQLAAGLTRAALLASPLARGAKRRDLGTGWMHVDLAPQDLGGHTFLVSASFEGERLDGYSLSITGPRFAAAWDEKTERARRDAHDAWLEAALGKGGRRRPGLEYRLPWGEAWSSYDPRAGSSSIGVRFRRP